MKLIIFFKKIFYVILSVFSEDEEEIKKPCTTSLNDIDRYKRKLAISLLYAGKPKLKSEMEKVGYEWREFTGNGFDRIKAIDCGQENCTMYLYEVLKDMRFAPHYHKPQVESGYIIEGRARITAVIGSSLKKWVVEKGDTFSFPNYEHHYFEIEAGTKISIQYFPKFYHDDWSAKSKNS